MSAVSILPLFMGNRKLPMRSFQHPATQPFSIVCPKMATFNAVGVCFFYGFSLRKDSITIDTAAPTQLRAFLTVAFTQQTLREFMAMALSTIILASFSARIKWQFCLC